MCGNTIGPRAVKLHENPVTILRLSLKYVLSAKEFADVVNPTPAPANKQITFYLIAYLSDKPMIILFMFLLMCVVIANGKKFIEMHN